MKRNWLIATIAFVLVTNAIALIGIARNRSGAPVQTIELTERELPLQSMGPDNSGVGLRVEWGRPSWRIDTPQFDRSQLEAIGFNCRVPPETSARDAALLPRAAYVVLEYEGPAYEKLRQQSQPDKQPNQAAAQQNPAPASHLVPIDTGTDAVELRRRYPDKTRCVIMRAVIRARIEDAWDAKTNVPAPHRYLGYVGQIFPFYINVPLPYARLLAPLKPQTGKEPRYRVTLSFGSNLEPWVSAVKLN